MDLGCTGRGVRDGGDDQRTVEAGTEAFGDNVIGLPGAGVLRKVALVGEAKPQSKYRRCQQQQQAGADQHRQPRVGLDLTTPAVGDGFPDGLFDSVRNDPVQRRDEPTDGKHHDGADQSEPCDRRGADAEGKERQRYETGGDNALDLGHLNPLADHAKQGGQKGDGGNHGDGDGGSGADAESGDERQTDEQHAKERDHNGQACKHHRSSGGVDGDTHRFDRQMSGGQRVSVPSDDEEGVVNADTKADHGADLHREVWDGEHVCKDGDQPDTGEHAGNGNADGESHCHDGAEGQDQHDHRERQTDQLGLRRLEPAEDGTANLYLEFIFKAGFGDKSFGLFPHLLTDQARFDLVDVEADRDVCVGDLSGLFACEGDLRPRAWLIRAGKGEALVEGFGESEELVHHRDHFRVLNAAFGAENNGARLAGAETTEVLLERIETVAALGLGDLERAVELGAEATRGGKHGNYRNEPGEDHQLPVRERPLT